MLLFSSLVVVLVTDMPRCLISASTSSLLSSLRIDVAKAVGGAGRRWIVVVAFVGGGSGGSGNVALSGCGLGGNAFTSHERRCSMFRYWWLW